MPNWNFNEEYKLRLNLSSLALSIIEQDRITFCSKSRTAFLNRVFLHAYPRSEASISRRLEHLQEKYLAALEGLQLPRTTVCKLLEQLLEEEKNTLTARHTTYECAHSAIAHKLSDEVAQVLWDARGEGEFYTPSQYFKAVIEDYCRQNIAQREQIYFADLFATIRDAIERKQQLDIRNRNGVRFLVHPYRILADPQSSYHYLVCYARPKDRSIRSKLPYTLRINQLSSVRNTGEKAFLSEQDRKDLDTAVSTRGIQFLVQPCQVIRVQLTPKGVQLLNRHATLRPPQIAPPQGDVYTFSCTKIQAEYYFIKLGAEAKILSPASLQKRFAQLYARGAALYAPTENEAAFQNGNGFPPNSGEKTEKEE